MRVETDPVSGAGGGNDRVEGDLRRSRTVTDR
jgi:hypothetical protein